MRHLGLVAALLFVAGKVQAQTPTSCAGRQSTDTAVYAPSDVSEPVSLHTLMTVRSSEQPPDSGQRTRVSVIVNGDGRVDSSSARVLDPTNATFERDALQVVRGRTYWPACRGGTPVRIRIIVSLDYATVYGKR